MPQEAAALRDFNAAYVGLGSKAEVSALRDHVCSIPQSGHRGALVPRPKKPATYLSPHPSRLTTPMLKPDKIASIKGSTRIP
jgi:hypothetical protein